MSLLTLAMLAFSFTQSSAQTSANAHTPKAATTTSYYIKNYGFGTYLNGKKAGLSLSNDAQEWSFSNIGKNLFRVLSTDENGKYRNLCGYHANVFRAAPDHYNATEEYYNCYFYEIEDIYADPIVAKRVSEISKNGYYFIYCVYDNDKVDDKIYRGILGYEKGEDIGSSMGGGTGDGTTIKTYQTIAKDGKITISKSKLKNFENYIYTLEPKGEDYVDVYVGSTGYATFCYQRSLKVPASNICEVYGARLKADKTAASLSNPVAENSIIKARTGFIVKAEPNTTVRFYCAAKVGQSIPNNDLIGVTTPKWFTVQDAIYLLVNDGNDNAVFKLNRFNTPADNPKNLLAANKAYLNNPDPASVSMIKETLEIEEAAVGLGTVRFDSKKGHNGIHNINGVRVNDSYKGIVIDRFGNKYFQNK